MNKIIVIPVLLLVFVIQANTFIFASESSVSKTGENVDIVEKAGTKAEGAETTVVDTAKEEEVAESAVVDTAKKEDVAESVVVDTAKKEDVAESAVVDTAKKEDVSESAVVEAETKQDKSSDAVENESDIIAIVNDEKIIRKDFDKRLDVFRRLSKDVTRPVKMQVIDQLTKKILLKQFVETQDIEVGNEETQQELEKIKYFLKNNPSNTDKSLEEILETQGSSVAELEEEIKRTLALSKYLEKNVSVDDKKNYFDANKDAFNGARVKASHVLIDTRGMKTEPELEEAKKMIEIIKMEIDKGANFAEMAKKYSNCPSAEKGGDIGFFQRKGSIVEEFAEVAFGMDAGEISDPVKTQFGYHIIMVTEKEAGQDVSYEEVTDMVDFVYMQMKTESILKELYENAKIEIFL